MSESSTIKLATAQPNRIIDRIIGSVSDEFPGVEKCYSVLVETGVYSPGDETDEQVLHLDMGLAGEGKSVQSTSSVVS
jgi:hypothetical protein